MADSGTKMARIVREPEVTPDPEVKSTFDRLNFNVSPAVAAETRQLAESLNISMTQLFKFAFSIFKIAVEERRHQRKLAITDKNGKVLREFVIPGLD